MTIELSNFLGFGKSIHNQEYQKMLNDRFNSVFGAKEKISLSELLRKDSSVFEAYKKLDPQGQTNFERIISLDGDESTINEAEYKTLMSVLDAEDVDKTDPMAPMLMDGDFTVKDKNNGIYVLNEDNGIKYVYDGVETKEKARIRGLSKEEVDKELHDEIRDAMFGKPEPFAVDNKTGEEYWTGLPPFYTPEMIAEAVKVAAKYSSLSPHVYYFEALADYFGDEAALYKSLAKDNSFILKFNKNYCANGEIRLFTRGYNGTIVYIVDDNKNEIAVDCGYHSKDVSKEHPLTPCY